MAREPMSTKLSRRWFGSKNADEFGSTPTHGLNAQHNTPGSSTKPHMDINTPNDIIQNTHDERRANELAMGKHTKKPVKERGGFLSRIMRTESDANARPQQDAGKPLKNTISVPQAAESKEAQIAGPGVDAPVSAVNAGERKVLAVCNGAFINLPITPTTQTQDILYSAANCLSEDISPQSAVVVEYFKQYGLERPLRKFEYVRDVMNSWDSDTQNHLEIVTGANGKTSDEAFIKTVPRKQPPESSFTLYHSQKAGKWDKRCIALRSDGQISLAKKQDSVQSEWTNICHLSDFDIYTPNKREHKRLKPPKRTFFAVKSQQKSAMFLTSENFVHYFCTNDEEMGFRFYSVLQQWRSWYIANVLGAGDEKGEDTAKVPQNGIGNIEAAADAPDPSHTSTTPYQLGTFKPLLDLEGIKWGERRSFAASDQESPSTSKPGSSHTKEASIRGRPRLPTASAPATHKVLDESVRGASGSRGRSKTTAATAGQQEGEAEESPFMPSGLLGRTYTKRQNAMKEREKEVSEDGPFIPNGLVSNLRSGPTSPTSHAFPEHVLGYTPRSSGPSSRENTIREKPTADVGSIRSHSKSNRHLPKPLVDLTPTYQEPPQHARKGRGVTPKAGLPLVESATGPDLYPNAIVVPSATTWRKPSQTQRNGIASSQTTENFSPSSAHMPMSRSVSARQRSSTTRSTRQAPAMPAVPMTASTLPEESPFLPTGLLARSSKAATAQGSSMTGRGVATGDRNCNGRPLLDLSQPSQFADGSLLRGVEEGRIVADGERRVDRPVNVGEGY